MSKNWELKTLDDICEKIFAGGDVPKDNFSKEETKIYNIPIFANGIKDKGLYGFTNIKKVLDPSITVSARGTIGYAEIRNKPFFPIVRLIVLTPNKELVNLEFLHYILKSMDFKKSGTSIPQLTIPMIKKYQTNIPLIKIQKQIVKILDTAFEALEKAKTTLEKNLTNTKELFDSKLNEIFSQKGEGWEEKTLGDISILKGRIGWKGLTAKEYKESGPLFISVHSLNYGDYINFSDAFHISNERYEESPEIMLKKNDILICKDGAGIGKIGIVPELPDKATINSSLLLIRSSKYIETKYLYYSLLSPFFQKIVQDRLQGSTTPHLYQRDIKTFPIYFPEIKDQKKIILTLDNLNEKTKQLEKKYQQKLDNLEELKKSLLQKAFSGELTK